MLSKSLLVPRRLFRRYSPKTLKKGITAAAAVLLLGGGGYILWQRSHAPLPLAVFMGYQQQGSGRMISSLRTIRGDGSHVTVLAETNPNNPESLDYHAVDVSAAKYSPDHKYLAWQENYDTFSGVAVENVATKAVDRYSTPSGYSHMNVSGALPIVWYPNGEAIAMVLWNPATDGSVIDVLNLSGGKFSTMVDTTATDGSTEPDVSSLAVLGDNRSIVYTNSNGIEVVAGPKAPPRLLNAAPFCGSLRWRPGTATEFSYLCGKVFEVASGSVQLYTQTISSSPSLWFTTLPADGTTPSENLDGYTWSADGTSVALLMATFSSNICGPTDVHNNVALLSVGSSMPKTIATTANHRLSTRCFTNSFPDIDPIVFAPDGSSVAFIAGFFGIQAAPSEPVTRVMLTAPYKSNYVTTVKDDQIFVAPDLGW